MFYVSRSRVGVIENGIRLAKRLVGVNDSRFNSHRGSDIDTGPYLEGASRS